MRLVNRIGSVALAALVLVGPAAAARDPEAGVAWPGGTAVVSYEGELPRLRSVNAVLPPEIAVLAAERAPDGFSARRDARSRSYRYRVPARSAPSPSTPRSTRCRRRSRKKPC